MPRFTGDRTTPDRAGQPNTTKPSTSHAPNPARTTSHPDATTTTANEPDLSYLPNNLG